MDLLDDPFSSQPLGANIDQGGFAEFIEGLAGEDVPDGALLDDEYTTPSVPIPLPYSGNLDAMQGHPIPLDDVEPPFVPLPLADGEESTRGGALFQASGDANAPSTTAGGRKAPKTANERMEKLRAKNRRAQARYREKCKKEIKELEALVATMRAQLSDTNNRCRTLRHQRNTLLARLRGVASNPQTPASGATANTSPANAAAATAATAAAAAVPGAHCAAGAAGVYAPSASAAPHVNPQSEPPSGRASEGATGGVPTPPLAAYEDPPVGGLPPPGAREARVVPTRAKHSGNFFTEYDEVPRPISSFAHKAGISYTDVTPFMPPHCPWGASDPNTVAAAVASFQHSVSRAVSRPLSEICWFNQMNYELGPELRISHSAGAFSPECCLSLSLTYTSLTVEALFLLLEMENLQAASDPGFTSPPHPGLASTRVKSLLSRLSDPTTSGSLLKGGAISAGNVNLSAVLAKPQKPDPKLLSKCFVRCGVFQRYSAERAVEKILRPLLRQYRARLPLGTWRAICMASMNVVKSSVDALLKGAAKTNAGEGETSAPPSSGGSSELSGQTVSMHEEGSEGEASGMFRSSNEGGAADNGGVQEGHMDSAMHVSATLSKRSKDQNLTYVMKTTMLDQEERGYSSGGEGGEVLEKGMGIARGAHGGSAGSGGEGELGEGDMGSRTAEGGGVKGGMQGDQGGEMDWSELDKASLVVMQKMLVVFYETLTEPTASENGCYLREAERARPVLGPTMDLVCADHCKAHVYRTHSIPQCSRTYSGDTNDKDNTPEYMDTAPGEVAGMALSAIPGPSAAEHSVAEARHDSGAHAFSTEALCSPPDQPGEPEYREAQPNEYPIMMIDPRNPSGKNPLSEGGAPDGPLYPTTAAPPASAQPAQVHDMHASQPVATGAQWATGSEVATGATMSGAGSGGLCSSSPLETPLKGCSSNPLMGAPSTQSNRAPWGSVPEPSMGSGILCGDKLVFSADYHDPISDNSANVRRGAAVPDLEFMEGSGRNVPRMLGINGAVTRDVEDALQAVKDVHTSDGLIQHEFVSMTALPSWVLTEVQHARMMAASLDLGVNMVDCLRLFQAAANEQRWEALFDPIRAAEHA